MKGKRPKRKTTPAMIVAREKSRKACELRVRGYSLDEIAKELGYANRSSAWKAIRREMELEPAPEVEHLRKTLLGRLDKAHKVLDVITENEDPSLRIDAVAKIQRGVDVQARVSGVVKVSPPIVVPIVQNMAGDISKLTPDEVWQLRELQKKMGALPPEEPK